MDHNGSPEHQTQETAGPAAVVGGCWSPLPPPPAQWPLCPLYGTVGAQLLGHAGSICQWQWGAPQHQHGPSIIRPLYTSTCPQLQPSNFTQLLNPKLSQSDWWGSSQDIDGYLVLERLVTFYLDSPMEALYKPFIYCHEPVCKSIEYLKIMYQTPP